jgi:hypothetical protein
LSPLSFKGEGEDIKRGASPLLDTLTKMRSKNLTNRSRIVLGEFCQILSIIKEVKLPDIVLGALIGVISAVVGWVISYRTSRMQINARRDELNQQLSYQEKEVQKKSLIESRKDYLLKLRSNISEWIENSHRQTNMIVRLEKAIKSGDSTKEQSEIRAFNEVTKRGAQISSQFDVLRGQVSDNTLDKLIEAVRETQYKVNTARMPLINFFNDPKGADIKTLESAMQKDELLRKEVSKHALQVNKRIEELLSGEPSD